MPKTPKPLTTTLSQAIHEFVRDGDSVALEGFTHLIPFAAGYEIIRQRKRNLTLIRMTPDLIYDQLEPAPENLRVLRELKQRTEIAHAAD